MVPSLNEILLITKQQMLRRERRKRRRRSNKKNKIRNKNKITLTTGMTKKIGRDQGQTLLRSTIPLMVSPVLRTATKVPPSRMATMSMASTRTKPNTRNFESDIHRRRSSF